MPEFVKALALLALRYGNDRRLAALRGNGLGVLRRNSAVGNDEHAAVQVQELTGLFNCARLEHDVIIPCIGLYGDDHICHSPILRFE